jgi:site-specific recombinase XerD
MALSNRDLRRHLASMRALLAPMELPEKVEKAWLYWAREFLLAHSGLDPRCLEASQVRRHVEALALERQVSAAVQNQMTRACVFLLREVLGLESPELTMLWQAARVASRPVILAPAEVQRLLDQLEGVSWLMASLSYGSGLRLIECVRLRVRDIKEQRIVVCDSSGRACRETVLPERVRDPMRAHMEALKIRHIRELADGFGGVRLPPNAGIPASAGRSWAWQFLFPGPYMRDADGGQASALRSHTPAAELRQAIEQAARIAEIESAVSENTLRNSFAAHLLQRGVAMSDVERLLGVESSNRRPSSEASSRPAAVRSASSL